MVRGVVVVLAVLAAPLPARAFCGFYVAGGGAELFNNATQVVLMREGTRTVLSMQNNYQGPPEDFAMVVPVPVVLQEENVKTLPRNVFERVDKLSAPRLVEYWEQDPCLQPRTMELRAPSAKSALRGAAAAPGAIDYAVTIEAQFTVGEYEIVILSARDALGLEAWLRDNRYRIPSGAEPLFRPYIQQGMKFFVAKVDVEKVTFKDGMAQLSPLRFHYDSERFELPVRLGLINAKESQDLIVHVLARNQRYELANYRNVTIPTNIDLAPSAKSEFGPFYASLFDRTLKKNPGAVVTEYSWDAASCDPCPTPPMTAPDLTLLGLDVLDGSTPVPEIDVKNLEQLSPQDRQQVLAQIASIKQQFMYRRMGNMRFVLTRLHARYDRKSLGEDLVFRAAPPIAGGREFLTNGTELEQGAKDASVNNFQARYAIRYPWKGPVNCSNPVYGRWGGPPQGGLSRPTAAQDLAFTPRSADLARQVESPVRELGLSGVKARAGIPRR